VFGASTRQEVLEILTCCARVSTQQHVRALRSDQPLRRLTLDTSKTDAIVATTTSTTTTTTTTATSMTPIAPPTSSAPALTVFDDINTTWKRAAGGVSQSPAALVARRQWRIGGLGDADVATSACVLSTSATTATTATSMTTRTQTSTSSNTIASASAPPLASHATLLSDDELSSWLNAPMPAVLSPRVTAQQQAVRGVFLCCTLCATDVAVHCA
jgi:hypothetical protein